jgi:hypothetical protein
LRHWNDPASWIEDGVKIAIRGAGNFHGGHQIRPWPRGEISGVRHADARYRPQGDAAKPRACPKSFELCHFVSGIVIVSGKTSLSGGSSIECLMPDSG